MNISSKEAFERFSNDALKLMGLTHAAIMESNPAEVTIESLETAKALLGRKFNKLENATEAYREAIRTYQDFSRVAEGIANRPAEPAADDSVAGDKEKADKLSAVDAKLAENAQHMLKESRKVDAFQKFAWVKLTPDVQAYIRAAKASGKVDAFKLSEIAAHIFEIAGYTAGAIPEDMKDKKNTVEYVDFKLDKKNQAFENGVRDATRVALMIEEKKIPITWNEARGNYVVPHNVLVPTFTQKWTKDGKKHSETHRNTSTIPTRLPVNEMRKLFATLFQSKRGSKTGDAMSIGKASNVLEQAFKAWGQLGEDAKGSLMGTFDALPAHVIGELIAEKPRFGVEAIRAWVGDLRKIEEKSPNTISEETVNSLLLIEREIADFVEFRAKLTRGNGGTVEYKQTAAA